MMNQRILFVLGLVSLSLFSCTPTATVTPDPKLGDSWVVRYTDYNEDGSLAGQQDITITTSEVIFNNESWVQLNSVLGSQGVFKMKSDGFHRLNNGTMDELYFTFPGNVNDSSAFHLDTENYYNITDNVNTTASLIGGMYSGVNQYSQYDANSIEGVILFTANEWFVKFDEYDEKVISPPGMFIDYSIEIVSYTAN